MGSNKRIIVSLKSSDAPGFHFSTCSLEGAGEDEELLLSSSSAITQQPIITATNTGRRTTKISLLFLVLLTIGSLLYFWDWNLERLSFGLLVPSKNTKTLPTSSSSSIITSSESDTALNNKNEKNKKEENNNNNNNNNHRSCYVNYKTPWERSLDIMEQYQQAEKYGFGNCGENNNGTSLEQTLSKFSTNPIILEDDNSIVVSTTSNFPRSRLRVHHDYYYVPIHHITFVFQAYTENGIPRTIGGDEFILTFRGWTTPPTTNNNNRGNNNDPLASTKSASEITAFKMTSVAQDYHNGTYSITLPIPRVGMTKFNMTMMHYYTCYQGYTIANQIHSQIQQNQYLPTHIQPLDIMPHESFINYLKESVIIPVDDTGNGNNQTAQSLDLPPCPNSQDGMDLYSHGIWIESGMSNEGEEISAKGALWSPLCCQPGFSTTTNDNKLYRIGDSTMPVREYEFGNVYGISTRGGKTYEDWIDFLWNLYLTKEEQQTGNATAGAAAIENKQKLLKLLSSDVLILNAGLHFVFHGKYTMKDAVELIIRMVCQIGTMFQGKIMWIGPVPIQQHHFKAIDQKDSDIQYVDAIIRERLLQTNHGQLNLLCKNSSIDTLETIIDGNTGTFQSEEETHSMLESIRRQRNITKNRDLLKAQMEKILKRSSPEELYGTDRHVMFAEIDHFLRPRSEVYREHDKIHDGGEFFFSRHSEWINTVGKLRQLGEA